MAYIYLVLIIVFMVINLIIYHKIFTVYYFDLSGGLMKELVYAFFIALLEIALFKVIGIYILIAIGIIAAIFAVIGIIKGVKQGVDSLKKDKVSSGINREYTDKDAVDEKESQESCPPMEVLPQNEEAVVDSRQEAVVNLTSVLNKIAQQETVIDSNSLKKDSVNEGTVEALKVSNLENVEEGERINTEEAVEEINIQPPKPSINENANIVKKRDELTMFCPYCGNTISRQAKFCNYCGKKNSYMEKRRQAKNEM